MLHVTCHHGNEDRNNEVPLLAYGDGRKPEHEQQAIAEVSGRRNSHRSLTGMRNGATALEESLAVSHKAKYRLSSGAPWYLSRGAENVRPHENLHMNVYSSFIHNYVNSIATKISLNRRKDKQTVVQPYDGMLLGNKKKQALEPQKDMEES